jgi:Family of unknown function (DUF5681)
MPENKKRSGNATSFKKGVSGNPGGRPKTIGEVQELARQHTPLAIQTLASIAAGGKNETARVAAADKLLERGWGKAAQPIGDGEGGQLVVQVVRISADSPTTE